MNSKIKILFESMLYGGLGVIAIGGIYYYEFGMATSTKTWLGVGTALVIAGLAGSLGKKENE